MLEAIAELDDDVMLAVIEEREVSKTKIHELLRLATIQGQIQPVFCGSSLDFIGVQPVLDAGK